MTKHDAIRISQLHQIFPEVQLTERQKDIAVMYVIGCTVEEIASEKGDHDRWCYVSFESGKKSRR